MAEDFKIQRDAYLHFDATTIQQYVKDRLRNDPNNKFTDYNFEGSHFSTLTETIAYLFNVLMFYLNQTSTESKFTDAQLYENVNRMVKLLGYNPIGYQTSVVPFSANDTIPDIGLFVVPRYSYINVGGTTYSFSEDFVFRSGSSVQASDGKLLYQGKFYEYPLYTAVGLKNEIVFLAPGDNVIIDHFNIHVYVKSTTGVWEEWSRVETLITTGSTDKAYEVRFNENMRYEIKFGNGINGQSLTTNDSVAIYYLQSDGSGNEIVEGDLSETRYIRFASTQFLEITDDIWETNPKTNAPPENVTFNNDVPATTFAQPESVDTIRQNAPDFVKRKLTITKTADYERVVMTKFPNMVVDVKAMNNFDYIKTYMSYFKNLGLESISAESRFLYNQVTFADACNFNNIYVFIKPKIYANSTSDYNRFLSPSLKRLILNEFDSLKEPTVAPIVVDPIYMAVGLGINNPTDDVSITDVQNSRIVVVRDKKSLRSVDVIRQDIYDIFVDYFSQENTTFGKYIDFPYITNQILSVNGVVDFRIERTDTEIDPYYYGGLSMIVWNPVFTSDVSLLLRSETLEDFQVPYFFEISSFIDKIHVETEL